jgi:hypothetical protein
VVIASSMSLAISLFVTILVIYSGFKGVEVNRIKPARTFGAGEAKIPTQGHSARQHSHDDRGAQGQCWFVAGRRSAFCADCVSRQS